jgi:RNA polymerase sigma factor (sigma-70 family)
MKGTARGAAGSPALASWTAGERRGGLSSTGPRSTPLRLLSDPIARAGVPGDLTTPFEQTVVQHLDAAYTLARYLLRDEEDARDAVQDAYLRALKYFDGFRGDDARAWILTIVRNTCHARYRQRKVGRSMTPFDDSVHSPTDYPVDDTPVLAQHVSPASLRDAMQGLPPEFREVVVLREVHGYSYKEIGAIVGVPIGTVMSRLGRARLRLRAALDPRATEAESP